jgi:hypothetical protein
MRPSRSTGRAGAAHSPLGATLRRLAVRLLGQRIRILSPQPALLRSETADKCRFGAGATPVTVDAALIPGARRLIRRCRRSGRTVGLGGTEVYNGSGGRGASFTWLLMR